MDEEYMAKLHAKMLAEQEASFEGQWEKHWKILKDMPEEFDGKVVIDAKVMKFIMGYIKPGGALDDKISEAIMRHWEQDHE